MKKLNFNDLENTLDRAEMKQVMAGSGTNGACEGVRLQSGGPCVASYLGCAYYSGYCEPCNEC